MNPTPYPELNDVLRELVESLHALLKADFNGAYLQGSFAVGGFDEHSDVDFIIVIDQELSEEQVKELQKMHERVYCLDCEWAKHLEGSYFPRNILKDYSQRGKQLWYLDNGSRSLIQSDHCNSVVVRWTVREHGVAMTGPNPKTLVDPIPVSELRREILHTMHDWGNKILAEPAIYNNRFYQSFIVLSYCRMLHDFHYGMVSSKRTAAEWAKTVIDPAWAGLIDRTWSGRPNPAVSVRTPADPKEFEFTLQFIRYIMKESANYG